MKNTVVRGALLALIVASGAAQAARPWILPSQTVLAQSGGWVAVDAAQADDLFSPNQATLSIDGVSVTGPGGALIAPQNPTKFRTRGTFDLELRQVGSYRIAAVEESFSARWEEDGKPKRWRGSAADIAANVPANAAKLELDQTARRVEAFVTVGAPSALNGPSNKGLELVAANHPNDLYEGEPAAFKLLVDGKPAAGLEVQVIAGGTRYRNSPDIVFVKTDAQGAFSVTWPKSGLYWLEASTEDTQVAVPSAKKRTLVYAATLEVFPQ